MKIEGWIATDGKAFLACESREVLEQELPTWGFNADTICRVVIGIIEPAATGRTIAVPKEKQDD